MRDCQGRHLVRAEDDQAESRRRATADPKLDVVALLQRLSQTELPANVLRELSDWSEHGEKFVVYSGLAVLEADKDLTPDAAFTVEAISPGTYLVRSPDKLFYALERRELMPLRVKHLDGTFTPLPKTPGPASRSNPQWRRSLKRSKPS